MCGTPAPGPGRLVESRNAIEHTGWTLARVKYAHTGTGVTAAEPEISGQPVTEFVKFVLDRLCCYVWPATDNRVYESTPATKRIIPSGASCAAPG